MTIYRYPEPRRPAPLPPPVRPAPSKDEAPLSGLVQGKDASNLEEMFARSLDKDERVQWFSFRRVYGAPNRNMAGAIELDFYVNAGSEWPIQIDGEWIHKGADSKMHDGLQDARLDDILRPQGARPVVRLRFTGRETQEEIDEAEARLF